MKRIVISIQNFMLAEAIAMALKKQGQFNPERIHPEKSEDIVSVCRTIQADILLMEVTHLYQSNMESRLKICSTMKEQMPECKLALICDDSADSALADEVKQTKQLGRIDTFFFMSVTARYLVAALDAL